MAHSISQPTPLKLIIRFSASIPDLALTITSPQTTTPTTLSTLIRPHLPSNLSACPLRYIYAGALLQPTSNLAFSLRLSKPLSPSSKDQKFYIHCAISINTSLTPIELEAEARATKVASAVSTPSSIPTPGPSSTQPSAPAEPQGFDRLLTAGFTAAEIACLRSQFLVIHSHTRTPDNMPSGLELRRMEEEWLDNNSPSGSGQEGGGGGWQEDEAGALDDMLWGNVMGFFWALPAITWLMREEGVWSKRRQVAVLTGVLVNFAFCVLRAGT